MPALLHIVLRRQQVHASFPMPLSAEAAAHGVSHGRPALQIIFKKGHENARYFRIGQDVPAIVDVIGPVSLPANRSQDMFVALTIERARSVRCGIAILAAPNFLHGLVREP